MTLEWPRTLLLVLLALLAAACGPAAVLAQGNTGTQPVIAGWIERITFPELGLVFSAKLDTGADSSSINAEALEIYRVGRQRIARFKLVDDEGRTREIERQVVRRIRVKRAGGHDDRRVVVRMKVCVGGITTETDFSVADRDGLEYQILIGRTALAGGILVDSSRTNILTDGCLAAVAK